jgi:hypothetical protein
MKLTNSTTNIIAIVLLGLCFLFAFFSIKNMSLTMDEKAHIPSGFSYLLFQDYRLNPEHPPLAKDLSAIPLLFLNLNFPTEYSSWTNDVNGQWESGSRFIFKSGNNPDQIIFWSRLPMILLLLALGWFIFFWVRKLGGNKPALLALTLFSFSPTFLAHGRLVTTDVAAVFGFLIATYFWLKFLKKPCAKNIFIAGIMLGIALCLKFSLILLLPFFALITLIYAYLKVEGASSKAKLILKYIGLSIIAGVVALVLVIWPIYQFHISNYPIERQISDTKITLASHSNELLKNSCIWMAGNPALRPIAQYALGLLMATQRVSGGNTVYFLGQVSGDAWKHYFPIMYLLKVPLSFHILTLLLFLLWLFSLKRPKPAKRIWNKLKSWLLKHFTEFSLLIFFIIYWTTSITGNLNIGIRHILPIFPIMYIWLCLGLFRLMKNTKKQRQRMVLGCFAAALVVWYIASSVAAFPHYLSYYNELVCGSKNGYKYAVDSNYDWGQDLKRLANFVEKNNIQGLRVSYFGGDDTEYRLGDKLEATWIELDPEKRNQQGWIAISATFLQEGRAKPAPGYDRDTAYFNWLNQYEPFTRIGNSIFVYYLE